MIVFDITFSNVLCMLVKVDFFQCDSKILSNCLWLQLLLIDKDAVPGWQDTLRSAANGAHHRHLCMLIPHQNRSHTFKGSLDLMSEPPKCCICLDEFTSPASLPCGHCFCLGCIGEYWRIHGGYQCPLCKAYFPTRPQLKTEQTLHAAASTEEATVPLKAGEVACDLCPVKRRALKSCLDCMASYCAAHLEPHYQNEDLGRHLLISVAKNLEDSVCGLHGKQLNKFCRSDQTCICAMCAQTEHRGHHIISIHSEAAKKKVILRRRSIKLQQAIQERLSKVEKIQVSAADFNGENPKETRPQTKELITQLEEEISELQRKNSELEHLSQTEDNLHFLQVCSKVNRFHTDSCLWPYEHSYNGASRAQEQHVFCFPLKMVQRSTADKQQQRTNYWVCCAVNCTVNPSGKF